MRASTTTCTPSLPSRRVTRTTNTEEAHARRSRDRRGTERSRRRQPARRPRLERDRARSRARARRRGALGRADGARLRQRHVQRVLSVRVRVARDHAACTSRSTGCAGAARRSCSRTRPPTARARCCRPISTRPRRRSTRAIPATATRGAVSTTAGRACATRCSAALFTPTPPIAASARLALSAWSDGWTRVARFALLSVRRMGEEEFGSDAARRLLAGSRAARRPLAGGGARRILRVGAVRARPRRRLAGARRRFGPAHGRARRPPARRAAARSCATRRSTASSSATGARSRCEPRGEEIRATRAVLADVGAPSLYLDLVGAEHLSAKLLDDVRRFEWDNATVKVDWNLDRPIPWTAEPARRAGTLHLADSVDALTESSSALARGLVPATPFLIMGQQSMTDPTRMPPGAETVWAYSHVPREIRGDAARRDRVAARPRRGSNGSPTACSARSRSSRPASATACAAGT